MEKYKSHILQITSNGLYLHTEHPKRNSLMKKKATLSLLILSVIFFHSCKTYEDITYVQGLKSGDVIQLAKNIASTINTNDALLITVSAANPEAVAPYNPPVTNSLKPGETLVSTTPSMQNYLVDPNGYINFPSLGRIKVAGLTRTQLEEQIKATLDTVVTDPIVKVQILTNNVTVLGEVTSPGRFSIPNERLTLFEALGFAKDLTIYARRDNILITRETEEGKLTSIRVDLTSPDVFSSPGFYLQKGDIVYVEPNEYRKSNSTYNSNKQFNVSMISTIISGVSVIASLIIALFVK